MKIFLPDPLLVIYASITLLFPVQRVAVTSRLPKSFTMVSYLINCYYHSIVTMQPRTHSAYQRWYVRLYKSYEGDKQIF